MKMLLIVLITTVGLFSVVCRQKDDAEKDAPNREAKVAELGPVHSFPRIIDDVLIRNGEFIGTERIVEIVTQRFVVYVPGSEGNLGRPEQRTREMPIGGSVLYRSRTKDFDYRTVDGRMVEHDAAVEWIGDNHVLLLLPKDYVLTKTSKRLFTKNAIVALPNNGG